MKVHDKCHACVALLLLIQIVDANSWRDEGSLDQWETSQQWNNVVDDNENSASPSVHRNGFHFPRPIFK